GGASGLGACGVPLGRAGGSTKTQSHSEPETPTSSATSSTDPLEPQTLSVRHQSMTFILQRTERSRINPFRMTKDLSSSRLTGKKLRGSMFKSSELSLTKKRITKWLNWDK